MFERRIADKDIYFPGRSKVSMSPGLNAQDIPISADLNVFQEIFIRFDLNRRNGILFYVHINCTTDIDIAETARDAGFCFNNTVPFYTFTGNVMAGAAYCHKQDRKNKETFHVAGLIHTKMLSYRGFAKSLTYQLLQRLPDMRVLTTGSGLLMPTLRSAPRPST